jgi:tetratricopeptide (TPR) repeat protein
MIKGKEIMKEKLWFMTIIVAVILTGVSSTGEAAYPQIMTYVYPWVNMPRPTDDPRWAKAFEHWDKREDTDEVMAAIAIIMEIARDNPESFEAQLWLSRVNFLMGMRKLKVRESYCKKAIAAGEKALKIKPGDDSAMVWLYSSIVLIRDLTEEEYLEVQAMGLKYRPVRPVPVPDDDPLWAEAVKKYDARMDHKQALAAIEDFKKLDAKSPDRIEAKLFLSWSYYYLGLVEPDKEGKIELFKTGAEWGRLALSFEPRNPAANYALAATLGLYCENAGMIAMVRHSFELGKAVLIVVEEDPVCMYVGFSRYLAASLSMAGELAFKVAGMLGFPEGLIVRVSVFSTKLEPAYFDNNYRLASMYITLEKMDEAKEALEYVIKTDPATLKFYEPENRVIKKQAQELYDKHFK